MYIKQLIIEGFKSYGQRTVVEPFDPRHNVVVGRNGSGKSNFFSAIQFVLSDEFTNLSSEQRQGLLHETSGPRIISASVEIIFDNSDRRLPIEKDTVSLKRIIGLKNDHYVLNKRVIAKNDVINLLEAAGFSRSNPYYIVKQGQINQMALSSSSRLELLSEIAGSNVFEERNQESQAILRDSKLKLQKIADLLKTLNERLESLKEDTEELKEFQKWNKQYRTIEHVINDRLLSENKEKIQELENQREKLNAEQKPFRTKHEVIKQRLKGAHKEYKKAQKELESAEEQADLLKDEQEKLLKEKTELTFTIQDLNEEIKKNNDDIQRIEQELNKLNVHIEENKPKLHSKKQEFEDVQYEEKKLKRELDLKQQKRKELYNKHGRGTQFSNKAERDAWIKQELEQLNKQINDKKDYIINIEEKLKQDEHRCTALERKIKESTQEIDRQLTSINELNKKLFELKQLKDKSLTKRNNLYRQDKDFRDQIAVLKEDLNKADQQLRSIFGKSAIDGRNSIHKVLESFNEDSRLSEEVQKYRGLVIENFDSDPELFKAIEVTAGNRLFYHIVETNEFANKILKEMNNQKLPGEVTFMPLDRLIKLPIPNYPKSSDAFPMIQKLAYESEYETPLRNIFGRILLCRDLEIAARFAREFHLDCVTLSGDQAASKGWLKGGHHSSLRSSMKAQKDRVNLINEINFIQEKLDKLNAEIKDVDCNINSYINDEQRTETKISNAKNIYNQEKDKINMMKKEISTIDNYKDENDKCLQEHKFSLENMLTTKESLENEQLQDFTEDLSAADQQQIHDLNDAITELTKELKQVYLKRIELEKEKNRLENLLNVNLLLKKDQLLHDKKKILMEDKQQLLDAYKGQLSIIDNKILENSNELKLQKEKVAAALEKQKANELRMEKLHDEESQIQKQMEVNQEEFEKLINKINRIKNNIDNYSQKISELGVIPSNKLYKKFSKMINKQLFKNLENIKHELKKYDHVNKKALDQFDVISSEKDNLSKRKEELDRGYEKIQELIEVLRIRKCEAIEFTFKQVSKYFSEIFSKLVPNSKAQLIMKIANEKDNSKSENLIDSNKYVGIDIKVSFTGQKNETKEMNQLSGGQKSLVALTLLFAIQKCDPAPFYLFDEIDQALDAEHRKAVAEMIHELSSNAQFITTTFRSELLQHANKFYGVKFKNNKSYVECVNRKEATEFVEAEH